MNDRWLFNVGLRDMPSEGGTSILVENGEVSVTNLEIHELEAL